MEQFVSDSSWIASVEYYNNTQKMIIFTKEGKSYSFANVPYWVYKDFKNSPSHGEYYNNNIRGKYIDASVYNR